VCKVYIVYYIMVYIYVCVCVCVYIYLFIYTHTHTHTYICGLNLSLLPLQGCPADARLGLNVAAAQHQQTEEGARINPHRPLFRLLGLGLTRVYGIYSVLYNVIYIYVCLCVCVCVCVCIFIYIYTHIHTYICRLNLSLLPLQGCPADARLGLNVAAAQHQQT